MKYIYFILALTYFYVSAEDKIVLEENTPVQKCQCVDILNKIIEGIKDAIEQVNIDREEISKIKTDLQKTEDDINANSVVIDELESGINALEVLINNNLKTIDLQSFILGDIDAKVKALTLETEALDCIVDDATCSLNDILEIVLGVKNCLCAPKTTEPSNEETTPTSYIYQH